MIGMMITHPKLQAGSLGREILAKIERGLVDRRLRLNATRSAWPLYQSVGFRETGTVVQYQGLTMPIAALIYDTRTTDRRAQHGNHALAKSRTQTFLKVFS